MSYGIWRKRGKGWCSIEVDSPWNGTSVSDLENSCWGNPVAAGFLTRSLDKYGIRYDDFDDDVAILRWMVNQRKNQPQRKVIAMYFGGGEHVTWIAVDDIDVLNDALSPWITEEERNTAHELVAESCSYA